MDVAQITRKNYDTSGGSPAAALPTQQNPAGKSVAEIMEPDVAASVGGDHVPRQANEHSVDRAVLQLLPLIRDEERLGLREQTSRVFGRSGATEPERMGCSGTCRECSNLLNRTVNTPWTRSTSSTVSARASEMRSPVQASSPSSVR